MQSGRVSCSFSIIGGELQGKTNGEVPRDLSGYHTDCLEDICAFTPQFTAHLLLENALHDLPHKHRAIDIRKSVSTETYPITSRCWQPTEVAGLDS